MAKLPVEISASVDVTPLETRLDGLEARVAALEGQPAPAPAPEPAPTPTPAGEWMARVVPEVGEPIEFREADGEDLGTIAFGTVSQSNRVVRNGAWRMYFRHDIGGDHTDIIPELGPVFGWPMCGREA